MSLQRELTPRGPSVDKIVVGIQAYNRPDMLWRTLRTLQLSAERAPWLKLETIGLIDRLPDGSVNSHVLDMFEKNWPGLLPIDHIIVTDRNLDANDACLLLTTECFNRGDFVIHSEDDIHYSHDFFDFMACGFQKYKDVADVLSLVSLSVLGNDKTYHEVASNLYSTYLVDAVSLYGVGWFRRTFEKMKPIWPPSGPMSLDAGIHYGLPAHERRSVCPTISRSRHIGFYQGRYGPWADHSAEQFSEYERLNYLRWDADCFHPKCVIEYPWQWV